MPLPWFRFDSSFASHDKVVELAALGARGKAAGFVYVCGLAYCVTNETDGLIPFRALPFVHATRREAELLVEHAMWKPHPQGWEVVNYLGRQPSAEAIAATRSAMSAKGRKANCVRWHGINCGCWRQSKTDPGGDP